MDKERKLLRLLKIKTSIRIYKFIQFYLFLIRTKTNAVNSATKTKLIFNFFSKISRRWSNIVYAGLQKPQDLEGIHIRVDYEFCKNNGWGHDKTCLQTKHAVFQLPEAGKQEVTEVEKDILKGLFYGGGHPNPDKVVTELKQFRMEAPPAGEKAELNFVQCKHFFI